MGTEKNLPQDAVVLNEESVKALLAIRGKEAFNARLNELVSTTAEKKMIVQIAKEGGGDDVAAWKMAAINELADTNTI